MKKALLVDTNFSAGPISEALLNEGYRVLTVGARASDCLAGTREDYHHLDYSNVEDLVSLANRLGVDVLVPGCNDLSYRVCCEASAILGLPSLETPRAVASLHDKEKFRDLCSALSLPAPRRFIDIDSAVASGAKIIVKPTDAFSGRGIEVVDCPTPDRLATSILSSSNYSSTGNALLEEYVEGNLFSYSAFLADGRVNCAFNVAEFGSVNPFVVDTSYVIDVPDREHELKVAVERIAAELGFCSGLMHLQYIASQSQLWIIEPTRRCPGDLYASLIEFATEYPYAQSYVRCLTNRSIARASGVVKRNIVRHTVSAAEAGIFESITMTGASDLIAWFPLATVGDHLTPSPGGRVAVSFFAPKNVSSRDALVEALLSGTIFDIRYAT